MKISIITATYNADQHLQRLIDSLSEEKTDEIEFIIVDGSSIDKTLSIIDNNKEKIDYYISEPDNGIYDAWNKGVKMANGEWIMFLGADDILVKDSISKIIDFINQGNHKDTDIITSKRKMIDTKGSEIRITGGKWVWPNCLKGMMISHPGALHRRTLFENFGLFDISYKIAGDYELLLRPKAELKAEFIDMVTVVVSEGGVSDSFKAIKEHYRAVKQHVPDKSRSILLNDFIVTCKYFTKKTLRKFGLNIHLNN